MPHPAKPSLIERASSWLVIPIALLLFLQWPLRDLVQWGSREANDVGQWLFALYVAVAVSAASRAHAHIAADALARGYRQVTRARLAAVIAVFGLLPWIGWTVWSAAPAVLASVMQLERFPDTLNPGYFVIKIAGLVLALTMGWSAIRDIAALWQVRGDDGPRLGAERRDDQS